MAIALLGFVAGVYTIFEFTTGQIFFTHKDVIERRFFREGEQAHIRLIIVGIMGSPGTMGRALAATIPVTFYLFLERKRSDIGKLGLLHHGHRAALWNCPGDESHALVCASGGPVCYAIFLPAIS